MPGMILLQPNQDAYERQWLFQIGIEQYYANTWHKLILSMISSKTSPCIRRSVKIVYRSNIARDDSDMNETAEQFISKKEKNIFYDGLGLILFFFFRQ